MIKLVRAQTAIRRTEEGRRRKSTRRRSDAGCGPRRTRRNAVLESLATLLAGKRGPRVQSGQWAVGRRQQKAS
jgi:hypothetical protein